MSQTVKNVLKLLKRMIVSTSKIITKMLILIYALEVCIL